MTRRHNIAAGLRHRAAAFGKPPPGKEKAASPGRANAAHQNDFKRTNYSAIRRARQRGQIDAALAGWLIFALALLVLNVGGVLS